MASWVATGCSVASYNDTYVETGTYNTKPYYVGAVGGRVLFWAIDQTTQEWVLDVSAHDHQYRYDHPWYTSDTDALPNNPWQAGAGGTPPTLAEVESNTYNHFTGGDIVFAGNTLTRGPIYVASGGGPAFSGDAVPRVSLAVLSGGDIIFDGSQIVNVWDTISGGQFLFGGGGFTATSGPVNNLNGGQLTFGGGAMNILNRGGGQSSAVWDFARARRWWE